MYFMQIVRNWGSQDISDEIGFKRKAIKWIDGERYSMRMVNQREQLWLNLYQTKKTLNQEK